MAERSEYMLSCVAVSNSVLQRLAFSSGINLITSGGEEGVYRARPQKAAKTRRREPSKKSALSAIPSSGRGTPDEGGVMAQIRYCTVLYSKRTDRPCCTLFDVLQPLPSFGYFCGWMWMWIRMWMCMCMCGAYDGDDDDDDDDGDEYGDDGRGDHRCTRTYLHKTEGFACLWIQSCWCPGCVGNAWIF